jgi:hypothetical protein
MLFVFLLLFTFTWRPAGPRFEAGELKRATSPPPLFFSSCLVTTSTPY